MEQVGFINPRTEPATVDLKIDRIKHWLSKGAQPTETVHNLFVDQKLIDAKKKKTIYLSKKRHEKMSKKAEHAAASKIAAPAAETAPEVAVATE
ncbi:MAG: 30S ribosomal protein S16 [Candidatus Magasanikbacteria bacterium]|nr:30S ribosomal protein S16 [Candidatus Magasanikbacteria bacterium]